MKQIVTGHDNDIGQWVFAQAGAEWTPNRGTAIGLVENGEILAGVVYENFNGRNCFVHLSAVPGRRWLNREFLWFGFHYAFEQLGCERITGMVASTNKQAMRANEHVGMELESILINAAPDGHIVVYRMFREDCKWLNRR